MFGRPRLVQRTCAACGASGCSHAGRHDFPPARRTSACGERAFPWGNRISRPQTRSARAWTRLPTPRRCSRDATSSATAPLARLRSSRIAGSPGKGRSRPTPPALCCPDRTRGPAKSRVSRQALAPPRRADGAATAQERPAFRCSSKNDMIRRLASRAEGLWYRKP